MTTPPVNDALDDRYLVPGLSRGLELLEAFSPERATLTLSELSRAIGLSRSSAYRLVYTLAELGYLVRDAESKAYSLGPRVLRLGFTYLAAQDMVDLARPQLEALRDRTNASAHLGILDGSEIVYMARAADRNALTSQVNVGTRLPAYATSIGRAILAWLPAQEVRNRFAHAKFQSYTRQTPASADQLVKMLAEDRARGYVVSRAAFETGICSIAAPIRNAQGEVVAAVNVALPEAAIEAKQLETTIKDAVMETATTISVWLGWREAQPFTTRKQERA